NYRCLYSYYSYIHGNSFYGWSEPSDLLELVVTGLYAPPSLAALPRSEVASGQDMTLQCRSNWWYDRCVLYKDGEEITHSWTWSLERGHQADFFFPAVNQTHDGTYRCYRFHSSSPHLWSSPSAPLVLRVSGTFSPSPESENRLSDAAAQDYTVGNLIRLILTSLVLVLMGVLLTEHWNTSRE
ncbi:platelet glycoprotein VI-like, partial [Gracilinanus agilis]|uniref:platelet glycoprotein VI-like n=1 Tax=Gracilinanus agilis TaxID=191870 RepID=UPI001CFF520E